MERSWSERIAPFGRARDMRALFELATTLAGFVAGWWMMLSTIDRAPLVTALLALPTGLFLTRLFVLQHDCGHGSFFSSRTANTAVGSALGVLTLTPYAYWKRTHSIHHATSGNLDRRQYGDIETLTVAEYEALSPWRKFAYRLYRHPLFFLTVGPVAQFVVKHRLPWDAPASWKKEWFSVIATDLAMAALVVGLGSQIGYLRFLAIETPLVAIAGPLGIWMFFVQHQYEGAYWERDGEWSFQDAGLKGSSFYDLPGWLHWFTAHIGLHHIHHLDSRIPSYRLAECMAAHPELGEMNKLGIVESLDCPRLKLWDEDAKRLVPFPAG